ncbi:hypothetical protein A0O34_14515 [Chryseobacterium glaciei]|uniref:Uncharacterized protein n=1 Tax=Chryseobacterium glaciei TaxID=1685010 RepID=A0A172XXA2_9FLAO|nr:hypothetical protein [Chryseobacterium glaciei]ANF51643.1 hypothetical protein A0O34_14515 [Chryseobacterium glaciei]
MKKNILATILLVSVVSWGTAQTVNHRNTEPSGLDVSVNDYSTSPSVQTPTSTTKIITNAKPSVGELEVSYNTISTKNPSENKAKVVVATGVLGDVDVSVNKVNTSVSPKKTEIITP